MKEWWYIIDDFWAQISEPDLATTAHIEEEEGAELDICGYENDLDHKLLSFGAPCGLYGDFPSLHEKLGFVDTLTIDQGMDSVVTEYLCNNLATNVQQWYTGREPGPRFVTVDRVVNSSMKMVGENHMLSRSKQLKTKLTAITVSCLETYCMGTGNACEEGQIEETISVS
jgi:hypothetical protein